jgi:tetratricopeptide (TPR) repeat protein
VSSLTGHTLGKYQIIERLGRGGMADVFKGYQPGLDRYVAVKVLHPHLSEDPDFITRFKREAKSVAELRHPHIVQVFDFDVQGENYYMVMEYVEGGQTLKQLLQELAAKDARLPLERALDIASKLADALDYAHGLGMVHRDIKPANVLLPTTNRPVLSDFGIARLLGETGLTSSGQMIGTPAYMSPEQGMGQRGDARSDIYALGIVLYEMLTGRPPYDADTPYAVILKHINDPLVPPRVLNSALPPAIERIVLKCLAKNPDDRFASMADLRDTLRAAIDDLKRGATLDLAAPQTAAKLPAARPAAPPIWQSRPARWIAALAVLIVVGGVIVVALRGQSPPVAEPTLPAADAPAEAPTSPAELPIEPSGVQALIDEGYQALFSGGVGDALDRFNQALALEPDNPHALVGWAVAELTRYGDADAAGQYLDQAASIIPDDLYLHYGYGLLYVRSEARQDPQASDAEITFVLERCGDAERVALCIEAYRLRSGVRFWNLGDADGGIADMDGAIALSDDPNLTAYLHVERGDYRLNAGDPAAAIEDYVAAYDLSRSGDYLERAAAVAVWIEDYASTLAFYERLLNEQAGNPHYLVNRGYVEWRSGDIDKAMQTAQRAIELSGALEGHYLLGLLLLETGEPQEALAEFRHVAAVTDPDLLYQATFPFLTKDFGYEIHFDMARAAYALGDADLALELIDQSLQPDDYWPQPYILRGQIFQEQGELQLARESYLRAREITGDPDLQAYIDELLASLTQ